jgi:CubicO group peptidase (beta-lactamase class C family)
VEKKLAVQPNSLFRIASLSKPITAVAVMMLVDQRKVKLDDPVLKHIKLKTVVPRDGEIDKRWKKITIRQCLQHTGGWDRERRGGFDPVGIPLQISRAVGLNRPPAPNDIVRYMMGQPLDFDPGERMVYSNFGYLVLGRVIEAATGQKYEPWVKKNVLGPVKAASMSLGKAIPEKRPKAEVRYYDSKGQVGTCLYPPRAGRLVPLPDGAENMEAFEAHGGWISSAIDLVRFASAFDYGKKSPLLSDEAIKQMWARPEGEAGFNADNKPKPAYYGCGWNVRPVGNTGKANTWHMGLVSGTSALLVRRFDGLNWAVLFNTDSIDGKHPADLIDGPIHAAADAVKTWPEEDLFDKK